MENYKEIKNLFVLDCIRKVTHDCIPTPIKGEWYPVGESILSLFEDGLLIAEDECYKLSQDGKKALLLFDEERKIMSRPLEAFKEVLIKGTLTDGRIPMMSFLFTHSGVVEVEEMMKSAIFAIKWAEMIDSIKEMNTIENSNWQRLIAQDKFYQEIDNLANPNAWHELGSSIEEAEATGMWLLNPGFVQITVQ